MRLLFARVGRTFCRQCGREVVRETAEVVARRLGELPAGTRLLIGFDLPVVDDAARAARSGRRRRADEQATDERRPARARPSAAAAARQRPASTPIADDASTTLRRKGFGRLLIDGRAVAFDEVDAGDAARPADAAGGRRSRAASSGEDLRQRLTDSIETAYREGGGAAWAVRCRAGREPPAPSPAAVADRIGSPSGSSAGTCGIAYEDPQPRLFSFNNPFGACPTCHGFGNIIELDMDLVVPDPTEVDRRRTRSSRGASRTTGRSWPS